MIKVSDKVKLQLDYLNFPLWAEVVSSNYHLLEIKIRYSGQIVKVESSAVLKAQQDYPDDLIVKNRDYTVLAQLTTDAQRDGLYDIANPSEKDDD